MYERSATGLSPNSVKSSSLSDPVPEQGVRCVAACCSLFRCALGSVVACMAARVGDVRLSVQQMGYLLSPETAESLFVLHQVTGNPIYREWGWKIFQAIET